MDISQNTRLSRALHIEILVLIKKKYKKNLKTRHYIEVRFCFQLSKKLKNYKIHHNVDEKST